MGGAMGKDDSPKASIPETKLEAKIVEVMQRRECEGSKMKSFNNIILKFPKIDTSLRKCKTIFEQFDEDKNGTIDPPEMKHCFHKLEIHFTEEEINDLFQACDINEDLGIKFNKFIVLLCLVYLLKDDPAVNHAKNRMGIPNDLEATFEILVDTFVFLDKNKDGHVSKNEMVQAINETVSGEIFWANSYEKIWSVIALSPLTFSQSPGIPSSGSEVITNVATCCVVAEEMDWDKNGMVNFKEFLFAFTRWVGIDDVEDDDDNDDEKRASESD